jgi:hypothetical protein
MSRQAGLIEARIHNARVHAVADALDREIPMADLRLTTVCGNCFTDRPKPTLADAAALTYVLVSPTGCIHQQDYQGGTDTACGLDATLQDWWWPL